MSDSQARDMPKYPALDQRPYISLSAVQPRGVSEPAADRCDFGHLHHGLHAQGQQPNTAKLKADAQNVVKIISGDKAKIETYRQVVDLGEQLGRADHSKKSETLSQKIIELEKKLGPEFIALVNGLRDLDPNSRDSQEIGSILEGLDESCED